MKFYEHYKRSLTKTITYRLVILVANGTLVYSITHNVELTLGFSLASGIVNTLLYFFHERLWNHIHFGKEKKQ